MLAKVMKRKAVGAAAALALVVAGVVALPATPAAAGYTRYFRLPNGDVAICYYSDSGQWLGCRIVGSAQ